MPNPLQVAIPLKNTESFPIRIPAGSYQLWRALYQYSYHKFNSSHQWFPVQIVSFFFFQGWGRGCHRSPVCLSFWAVCLQSLYCHKKSFFIFSNKREHRSSTSMWLLATAQTRNIHPHGLWQRPRLRIPSGSLTWSVFLVCVLWSFLVSGDRFLWSEEALENSYKLC